MAKYAGADWLGRSRIILSPLGAVVADILGQVHRGIYHIDTAVFSRKAVWGIDEVSIPIPRGLASFDYDDLTVLVFCCCAAGVEVEVRGASKYYLRLVFRKNPNLSLDFLWIYGASSVYKHGFPLGSPLVEMRAIKKEKGQSESWSAYSLKNPVPFLALVELVVFAHQSLKRVEIDGYGSSSAKIVISQRTAMGSVMERHRTFEKAWEDMKPLYEPLLPEHSEFTKQLSHAS